MHQIIHAADVSPSERAALLDLIVSLPAHSHLREFLQHLHDILTNAQDAHITSGEVSRT